MQINGTKEERLGRREQKGFSHFFLRSSFVLRSSRLRRSPLTVVLSIFCGLKEEQDTARSLRSLVIASLVTVKDVMSST